MAEPEASKKAEEPPKSKRGLGSVFRGSYTDSATGKLKKSANWHIQYWRNGVRHREAVSENPGYDPTNRAHAIKLLKKRIGEAASGKALPTDTRRTTYEDLKALIRQDYETNGQVLKPLNDALKRLDESFTGMKASDITRAAFKKHQNEQVKQGYANSTINKDMAALKRMLHLGKRLGMVGDVPDFDRLEENNVRKGFFERRELDKLLKHLPAAFQPLVRIGYITGWRMASELLTRTWQHVDFERGVLRLEPGETKNGEGREFRFTSDMELKRLPATNRNAAKSELRRVLDEQWKRAKALRAKGATVSSLFFFDDGEPIPVYADGTPHIEYRRAWRNAVKTSGISRIPHDFRRTAVRNLEMAGVPRSVAMKMVGHRTDSIYRRYAIVDEAMLQDGAAKLDAYLKRH